MMIKFTLRRFPKRFALLLVIFFACFHTTTFGQFKSEYLINNDIKLTIEYKDIYTECHSWGYHYGQYVDIKSSSLTNTNYSITFNIYVSSELGTGGSSHSKFVISNSKPSLYNQLIFNKGKQLNYPSSNKNNEKSSLWCENVKLSDIGLISARIEYWGTSGGTMIGNIVNPLPIELISFTGKTVENTIELAWSTASERNNEYFTIERTVDGIEFEVIGTIDGSGNSSTVKAYSFTDINPKLGTQYYRLSQTDFNGDTEFFDPISVEFKGIEKAMTVYPNPSINGVVSVNLNNEFEAVELNIYSLTGSLLSSEKRVGEGSVLENVILPEGAAFIVEIKGDNKVPMRFHIKR